MFCFYAHEKNARFVSVRKIVDDFSAFKDRDNFTIDWATGNNQFETFDVFFFHFVLKFLEGKKPLFVVKFFDEDG